MPRHRNDQITSVKPGRALANRGHGMFAIHLRKRLERRGVRILTSASCRETFIELGIYVLIIPRIYVSSAGMCLARFS